MLTELGKKLAERWATLLVLPGALYLGTAAAARTLGHRRALDVERLVEQISSWAGAPAATQTGKQMVLVAGVLLGSAAAGLAAQALGSVVERISLAAAWRSWPAPFHQVAEWRIRVRRRRWEDAHGAYHRLRDLAENEGSASAEATRQRLAAYRARVRIALEAPNRPTWSGDRAHAATVRLARDRRLHLPTVWPHLWLFMPETARLEITEARQALSRACALGGWAVLYSLLAFWWWPAALLGAAIAATSWHRVRSCVDTDSLLRETAADLYAADLARHLGIDVTGPLSAEAGDELTQHLHTEPEPPGSPSD
ncbi:hypothetical protein [Streptomyces sp. Ncost-T10-10d]|uniref:hypothetical protein n=1 Tax=Streptomyces sp. Ncost-T10-10d TaxID=1839774 RepID=UPI00081E0E49|nr:hypothetical protein [Streptomyces sp. Ncost-T10-10d]SCF67615.1 hypothetical protein GA0115254_111020 [Streptomyces sp. Ncost-T10-10d]